MVRPITQTHLPFTPWADPALARLPGMAPVIGSWIVVDDAYAAQMAERRRLVARQRADVLQTTASSEAALSEALTTILDTLPPCFHRTGDTVTCPDSRDVIIRAPLDTIAQIIQEDVLILQKQGDEHVLTAGLLCFPASWSLSEKIGRPLGRIHAPVPEYDAPLANRVQRLFDRIPSGQPLWRANALGYADPDLYHPKSEADRRDLTASNRYLRCERQTVLRLPRTDAIVFAVHTYVITPDALTPDQRATCPIDFA